MFRKQQPGLLIESDPTTTHRALAECQHVYVLSFLISPWQKDSCLQQIERINSRFQALLHLKKIITLQNFFLNIHIYFSFKENSSKPLQKDW